MIFDRYFEQLSKSHRKIKFFKGWVELKIKKIKKIWKKS